MIGKYIDNMEKCITFHDDKEARAEYYINLSIIANSCERSTELELYNYIIDNLKVQDCYFYISRAHAYNCKNKYKSALRDYRMFIALSAKNEQTYGEISYAYWRMADIYYNLNAYKKAILYAEKSLKTNPDKVIKYKHRYTPYYFALGFSLNDAIECYEELLYKMGEYDKVLSFIEENKAVKYKFEEKIIEAKTYIKLKKYDEAEEIINNTVNKFDSLIFKAKIEESKNNIERAIELYKQAEILENQGKEYNKFDLYRKLGKLYEKQNDYKNAFEYYEKLKGCNCGYALNGDLYYKLMQYEKALICYLEGLSEKYNSADEEAELDYKIGLIKKILGQNEEAVEYFSKAKDLDENNEEYKKAYDELKDFDKNPFREDSFFGLLGDLGPFDSREVHEIVEDIFDDWLSEGEIDDVSAEYMRQLISCKTQDDVINDGVKITTAGRVILEFLNHIDSLYTTEKSKKLKYELRTS